MLVGGNQAFNELSEKGVMLNNITILINGNVSIPFQGIYYCNPGDAINITGTLDLPEPFTVPVTIKMPIVRHANGLPTDDEKYLNTTIVNSVVTSTGTIPSSGDWKILKTRNNNALRAINAPFRVEINDVTFIA